MMTHSQYNSAFLHPLMQEVMLAEAKLQAMLLRSQVDSNDGKLTSWIAKSCAYPSNSRTIFHPQQWFGLPKCGYVMAVIGFGGARHAAEDKAGQACTYSTNSWSGKAGLRGHLHLLRSKHDVGQNAQVAQSMSAAASFAKPLHGSNLHM